MLSTQNVLANRLQPYFVVFGLLAIPSAAPGVQAPAEGARAVVLVKTFADGRTTREVVTERKSGSWTPLFPRLKGWTPPSGKLLVHALQVSHVVTEQGVRVEVSVMLGSPHQMEEHVASLIVEPGQPVVVNRLRDYGMQPVTFAVLPLDATTLIPPQVDNKTAGLAVENIETVMDPGPRYRVSIRNFTNKAAVMFFVRTFVADRLTSSGRQGNLDGTALIDPGGTFVFFIRGSSGSDPTSTGWSPASLDTIELATVLWDDGTFEGDSEHVAGSVLLYVGRRAQVQKVLDILTRVIVDPGDVETTVARLRGQLSALPVHVDNVTRDEALERLKTVGATPPSNFERTIEAALANVRTTVLRELGDAPTSTEAFSRWHRELLAQYTAARATLARR